MMIYSHAFQQHAKRAHTNKKQKLDNLQIKGGDDDSNDKYTKSAKSFGARKI